MDRIVKVEKFEVRFKLSSTEERDRKIIQWLNKIPRRDVPAILKDRLSAVAMKEQGAK